MYKSAMQSGYQFRNHTIKILSIICVALGFMSIIIPIIYKVSPLSGVVFTLVAFTAYYLISYKNSPNAAGAILTTILFTSSLAFFLIHGVYGALAYFLMFFAAIVSGMVWSVTVGIVEFIILTTISIPLAISQSASREIFAGTPMIPDLFMALLIAVTTLTILHSFSKRVSQMSANESTYVRRLTAYDTEFEKISEDRLSVLKEELTERTRRLQQLADQGKALSRLGHDAGNILTQLRLIIDQHNVQFDQNDKTTIEKSFSQLRDLLSQSQGSMRKSTSANPSICVNQTVSIIQKMLTERDCSITVKCEETICNITVTDLERILLNLLSNALDALEGTRRKTISISGKVVSNTYVLSVTDNGCGIDPHIAPLITEAWFSTKGSGHSGLGLASVQEILSQNAGELKFIHKRKGAQINIILPINV